MGAEKVPQEFLKRYRNQYLATKALRLSLLAAGFNETGRWLAVALNSWLGWGVPVLNLGPMFFLAGFFLFLRKWSIPRTAVDADRVHGLEDRLTSFVDFRGRPDIPAPFREAQAEELAGKLAELHPALRPARPRYVYAGPFLLALSLLYPPIIDRMPSPVLVNIWQSPPNHSRLQPPPDFFEDREKEEADADKTPLTRDEPVTSSTSADGGSDLPSPEGRAGDPPVLTGEVPADEHWNGFSRKGLRGPELSPGSIVSETVGRELSRIVDAVVPEERGEQPSGKTIEGRMTYRIVPSPSPGEEGAGGSGSAMSAGVEIEVDFDAISSRYRQLVMSYFSRISGDFLHERNGDDRNRKGTPGSGS